MPFLDVRQLINGSAALIDAGGQVYNVQAYNVKPSNATGNAANLQALINSLPSFTVFSEEQVMTVTPATLYFPRGVYPWDGNAQAGLGHAGIKFLGEGKYSSVLRAVNGLNSTMLTLGLNNGQSGLCNGFTVDGLGFDGNSANNSGANSAGLKLSAVHQSLIDNCEFHDFAGKHLWLSGVTTVPGFSLGVTVRSSVIDGNNVVGNNAGLYCDSTADCTFIDLTATNCVNNYFLDGSVSNAPGVYNLRFENCWNGAGSTTAVGFYGKDVRWIDIAGLRSDGNYPPASRLIRFDSAGTDVTGVVIGDRCLFRPGGGTLGPVMVHFNAAGGRNINNCLIKHNNFDATQSSIPFAWAFDGAGTFSNVRVIQNPLAGTFSAPVLAAGVKLVDNPGYVLPTPSTIAVGGSPFTYTNTDNFDEQVTVSGGTVSAIAVRGTTLTGITAGQFMIRQGDTITVTYTVAPNMFKISV